VTINADGANPPHAEGTAGLESQNNSEAEMEMEGAVAKGCVEAWRKALAGDEKGAMSQLDQLGKTYPNVTTVVFMKGQVLEHLGKKQEAIEFYKKAVGEKEFSTIHIFKLAEALRTTNQNKDAVVQYRRLIELAPGFGPGHIGLAKALFALDKNSPEVQKEVDWLIASATTELSTSPYSDDARRELEGVLEIQPKNVKAREMLDKMGKPVKPAGAAAPVSSEAKQ
jgi:predicted Zn-dependent protease